MKEKTFYGGVKEQGFRNNSRSVRCNTKEKADRLLEMLKKQKRWYMPDIEKCVDGDKTTYYVWFSDKVTQRWML